MDAITELIAHFFVAVVFLVAMIVGFKLIRRLYGGRFTSAIPYLLIGITLLLGMVILDQVDVLMPSLNSDVSDAYPHGIQVLQLVATIFFIKALYEIYQARFATEGFLAFEEKKGGKK
jgi:TRAP-type C4-dicarboxylate transport system permease small subunit